MKLKCILNYELIFFTLRNVSAIFCFLKLALQFYLKTGFEKVYTLKYVLFSQEIKTSCIRRLRAHLITMFSNYYTPMVKHSDDIILS